MDSVTGEVVSGPDVVSRGFVYVKESEQLMEDATEAACDALEQCYIKNIRDMNTVKTKVRDAVSRCLYLQTRRSPMILPIVMYV
jgi:ribonuclease J